MLVDTIIICIFAMPLCSFIIVLIGLEYRIKVVQKILVLLVEVRFLLLQLLFSHFAFCCNNYSICDVGKKVVNNVFKYCRIS